MLRYASVLFDLDGTLIDSREDLVNGVRYALRQVDPREPPGPETIVLQVGKPLEAILSGLGYPAEPAVAQRFVDNYRAYYSDHFGDHTTVYPGIPDLLQALVDAGARLAVVTTKHQAQAEFSVNGLGLARYFRYVHGWQDGRQHKPHPEPILAALRALGARAQDALMVGDTEQDILAARAAGVATCAVTYGFRPALLLRPLRPDYLISSADDLLPIVVGPARDGTWACATVEAE